VSQQEIIKAKLKLMKSFDSEIGNLEIKKFIEEFNIKGFEYVELNDLLEEFRDELYEKYLIHGKSIYEIVSKQDFESSDIFEAVKVEDGIELMLSYYNGGCCFSEAVGYALDKLEE
jgi:hypothetical protein